MKEMSYAEAMADALRLALESDERVLLIGDFFGGREAAAFYPVMERFRDRIMDPPISELGVTGMATGAAMTGLRPIVPNGAASFMYQSLPQLLNETSLIHYTGNGQVTVPALFVMAAGIRSAASVQHSASLQPLIWNTPGLQLFVPATPADAKELFLYAALRSSSPTVFITHPYLFPVRGSVTEGMAEVSVPSAEVRRQGSDVSIIACGVTVPRALEAAARLESQLGISAEVVDPRTLVPLDRAGLISSVARTGRAVVVDETQLSCGVTAELAAMLAEEAFHHLRAPIRRVAIPNTPIPYAESLELAVTPSAERIFHAAAEVCGKAQAGVGSSA